MILLFLILILLLSGLLSAVVSRWNAQNARWTALSALVIDLLLAISICGRTWIDPATENNSWIAVWKTPWIPQLGIEFHLGIDGLSLTMVILTLFLGILAVLVSWKEITERIGFFHLNLLWVLAGIVGVFLALDLFLFYFFWELMLVPMYFLIGVWGHENRIYAAYKFFIFTQVSGLLMLLGILGVYFIHGQTTGDYTFNYNDLIHTDMDSWTAWWLMWGFVLAFAVKLPAVPIHTWLPDAHTEAPTAGSVILAGLLLKTGAYGLLRFVLPIFPNAAEALAPYAMTLGAIGILYGAKLAFAQTDFKRLVAYTSVSHMGFVLLGIFAMNEWAYQGTVMQMIAHGLSTSALFIMAGILHERTHTRDLDRMGGLWSAAPRMGGVTMVFVMASLGLPGLANFVAEFLILIGVYQVSMVLAGLSVIGLVFATVYSLRLMQKVFLGPNTENWRIDDLCMREWIIVGALILFLIVLGLYPQPVLDTVQPTIDRLLLLPNEVEHYSYLPPQPLSSDIGGGIR